MFKPELVSWVRLRDSSNWYRVEPGSFRFEPEREWASQYGTFASGFVFCTLDGFMLSGPATNIAAIAIDRDPDNKSSRPPADETPADVLPAVTVYQTVTSQGLLQR
jgi:hypothetical protein